MLASRLGVAALIVIALSFFTNNRPLGRVHVMKGDSSFIEKEAEPKVTIGPFTIDPNGTDGDTIRQTIEVLRDSNILDEKNIKTIHDELERNQTDQELEAQALEAAGLEIARQLSALDIEKSDASQPERLSESEIQNLVVERLLSVQNQMHDEEAPGEDPSRLAPSPAPAPQPQGHAGDAATSVEDTASVVPPVPAAPSGTRALGDLKRIEGNFSGKTLMGTDFRNRDLSGLDFSNARLTAAEFDGSNLTGANFSGAKIQGASFAGAIMDDIILTNAQAQTAHFERASLLRANLSYANFAGAVLTGADLRGAVMESLNLNGAVMQGTRMGEAP